MVTSCTNGRKERVLGGGNGTNVISLICMLNLFFEVIKGRYPPVNWRVSGRWEVSVLTFKKFEEKEGTKVVIVVAF